MSCYCVRCRDRLSFRIARGKSSPDEYRSYIVLFALNNGSYKLKCNNCGYEWISRSKSLESVRDN